jgi:hypothetical protein
MILSLDIGATTGAVNGWGREYEATEIASPIKNEFQVFEVAKAIENHIRSINFKPDPIKLCLLEGYAYGSGYFNYAQPEITGQVKKFLVDHKIPFVCIPANSMRLAVIGNGRATKLDVRKYCIKNFNVVSGHSDHIYDAFLGFVFLKMYFTNSLSKEHQEMVQHSIVGGKL